LGNHLNPFLPLGPLKRLFFPSTPFLNSTPFPISKYLPKMGGEKRAAGGAHTNIKPSGKRGAGESPTQKGRSLWHI